MCHVRCRPTLRDGSLIAPGLNTDHANRFHPDT